MNTLNSILLEGSLVENPVPFTLPNGLPVARFVIASSRTPSTGTTVMHTHIETVPGQLTEVCLEYLRTNRAIRVVGRLSQRDDSKLHFITAEHVEFRP